MNRRILPMGLLFIITALTGTVLYWSGNYIVFMLAYIFSAVFLWCRTAFAPFPIAEKLARITLSGIVLAAQILFAVLVMRPAAGSGQPFVLCRLLGILIVFSPLLIQKTF